MLNDQELDKLELKLQSDSDWILNRINLLPLLQKYGDVNVVGGKALGLMIAQDIDISVIVEKMDVNAWQSIVSQLMVTPHVRKVTAIDYYNYTDKNVFDPDNGQKYSLYISLDALTGPNADKYDTWDCQIHLITPDQFDNSKLDGLKSKLDPTKRLTILRIKYWANEVNKTLKERTHNHFKINSLFIYEAVLDKQVTSIDDFIKFFKPTIPEHFLKEFEIAVSS